MDLAAIHERVKALQKESRELRTAHEEDIGEEVRRERELRLQQIRYELAQLMETTTSIKERGSRKSARFGRDGHSGQKSSWLRYPDHPLRDGVARSLVEPTISFLVGDEPMFQRCPREDTNQRCWYGHDQSCSPRVSRYANEFEAYHGDTPKNRHSHESLRKSQFRYSSKDCH